jgi:hypothetical protein
VAFIDFNARRHGRPFLGSIVRPVSWLARGRFDVIAISERDFSDPAVASSLALVKREQVLTFPEDATEEMLASLMASYLPETRPRTATHGSSDGALRAGIFGTGSAAMKVWETCTEIDEIDVTWFADNDARQHGRRLLWLEVIAPSDIPTRTFDLIIVGSMSTDAIRTQLRQLGVPPDRILTPNVIRDAGVVRAQIVSAMSRHPFEVIAR